MNTIGTTKNVDESELSHMLCLLTDTPRKESATIELLLRMS